MRLPSLTRPPALALFAATLASAQSAADLMQMQRGYFRGAMVRWEGTAAAGDLIAKDADGALYSCGYDSKTYIEMARAKISVTRLVAGDPLEILADRLPGRAACYVRIVQVVQPQRPRSRTEQKQAALRRRDLLPRGDRTLSGVVIRNDGDTLTLRTREGEVTMAVRGDTRFFREAQLVGSDVLTVNTRVSVRAGPTLQGDLQAYQVNWGGIVTPR